MDKKITDPIVSTMLNPETIEEICEISIELGLTEGEVQSIAISFLLEKLTHNSAQEKWTDRFKERKQEFNIKIKKSMREYYTKQEDIEVLKTAYYYYLCGYVENVGIDHHDKKRAINKYIKARDTIAELIKTTGSLDTDLIENIDNMIDLISTTQNMHKQMYTIKMEDEFNKIGLSKYKQNQVINSFKHFRQFDKFPELEDLR